MSALYRVTVISRRLDTETIVFFESPSAAPAVALRNALSVLWDTPGDELEIDTLASERELIHEWSIGPVRDGDKRLFETGCVDGKPVHCAPGQTLFLVRPKTLRRLVAAQYWLALGPLGLLREAA